MVSSRDAPRGKPGPAEGSSRQIRTVDGAFGRNGFVTSSETVRSMPQTVRLSSNRRTEVDAPEKTHWNPSGYCNVAVIAVPSGEQCALTDTGGAGKAAR